MKTFKKLVPFFVAVVAVLAVGIIMYTSADATEFDVSFPSAVPTGDDEIGIWAYIYDVNTCQVVYIDEDDNLNVNQGFIIEANTPIYIINNSNSTATINANILSSDHKTGLFGSNNDIDYRECIKLVCSEKLSFNTFVNLNQDGEHNNWLISFTDPAGGSDSQPKKPYTDALENNIKSLAALIKAGEVTDNNITWSEGQALPASVMDILKDNPTVTLTFNFDYLGNSYSITVKGSDVIDLGDDVDWYGPECLIRYYGSLWDKVNLAISKAN